MEQSQNNFLKIHDDFRGYAEKRFEQAEEFIKTQVQFMNVSLQTESQKFINEVSQAKGNEQTERLECLKESNQEIINVLQAIGRALENRQSVPVKEVTGMIVNLEGLKEHQSAMIGELLAGQQKQIEQQQSAN